MVLAGSSTFDVQRVIDSLEDFIEKNGTSELLDSLHTILVQTKDSNEIFATTSTENIETIVLELETCINSLSESYPKSDEFVLLENILLILQQTKKELLEKNSELDSRSLEEENLSLKQKSKKQERVHDDELKMADEEIEGLVAKLAEKAKQISELEDKLKRKEHLEGEFAQLTSQLVELESEIKKTATLNEFLQGRNNFLM